MTPGGKRVVLVAAVADNGVIGNGPDIPWRIPGEQCIDDRAGRIELGVWVARWREAHAPCDMLLVRQRVPGKAGGVTLQRYQLGIQPGAPIGLRYLRGDAISQQPGVFAEARR